MVHTDLHVAINININSFVYLCGAIGKVLSYRSGGHGFEPCHRTYTLGIVRIAIVNNLSTLISVRSVNHYID